MMHKITYEVELKPFQIPNFVIPVPLTGERQDGFVPNQGVPLEQLSLLVLRDMCNEFSRGVMKKAGFSEENGVWSR